MRRLIGKCKKSGCNADVYYDYDEGDTQFLQMTTPWKESQKKQTKAYLECEKGHEHPYTFKL